MCPARGEGWGGAGELWRGRPLPAREEPGGGGAGNSIGGSRRGVGSGQSLNQLVVVTFTSPCVLGPQSHQCFFKAQD